MVQKGDITIETWVRVDSRTRKVIFEGSYEDAMSFDKGHFMTKRFYEQYRDEFSELMRNL